VIFVIGANPSVNHPVAATCIKNAAKAGAKLIVADPRRVELARHADYFLQFNPDTDVALLNALLHVIVEEGLVDDAFIRDRTSGYEALAENVKKFSPEAMAPICGIDAQTIREVARLYATSKGSMILWGMGISQHVHGTDNARCLIALALSTGQIGKPGSGLHPLRGQNNVQGASDSGLIPMFYPDYQRVNTPAARERFEKLWKTELDPNPGLTVVEIMHARRRERSAGCTSWVRTRRCPIPTSITRARRWPALDHVVVQDIFLTETAYLADVVLPATAWPEKVGTVTNTDRMVQLGRKAIEPPGDAKEDFWLIVQLAKRMGLDWRYEHPRDAFNEMRQCMDSIAGITWERLEEQSSVTYPCVKEGDPAIRSSSSTRSRRQPAAASSCPPISFGERASRCGVPDGAHHRPSARTLAHGIDDPACGRARLYRAGAGRLVPSAGSRSTRRARRNDTDHRLAARRDLAVRACG
jgi:formate dehydrogenase major subunit